MLLDTIREGLAFLGRVTVINRQFICSTIGILFLLVGSAHHGFAEGSEPKRVLLLYHSFATNLVYAKAIRAELERQMPDYLELYDAPLLPASNESAQGRYADYLHVRFGDQRLDLVVGIGADALTLFQRYGNQVFSSTALVALLEKRRIPLSNLTATEAAVGSSTNFATIVENILQVLPETTNVAVVSGNSVGEQYWLEQMRMAFAPFAARLSFTWFNDLSVDDMLTRAATAAAEFGHLFLFAVSRRHRRGTPRGCGVLPTSCHRQRPPSSLGTMHTLEMALSEAHLLAWRRERER